MLAMLPMCMRGTYLEARHLLDLVPADGIGVAVAMHFDQKPSSCPPLGEVLEGDEVEPCGALVLALSLRSSANRSCL